MNFGLLLLLLAPIFCHAIDTLSEDEARAVAVSLLEDVFLVEATEENVEKLFKIPYSLTKYTGEVEEFDLKAMTKMVSEERIRINAALSEDEQKKIWLETKEQHDDEIRGRIENLDRDGHIEFSEDDIAHIRDTIARVEISGFNFVATMEIKERNTEVKYHVVFENGKFIFASEVHSYVTTIDPSV